MKDALVEFGIADSDGALATSLVVVRSQNISTGDVVLYTSSDDGKGFCQVWFHACIGRRTVSCISRWPLVDRPRRNVLKVRHESNPHIIETEMLEVPLVYANASEGSLATVLLPSQYQTFLD